MLIHFIRHTTPKIAPGICYGQADIELTNTFEKEAQDVVDIISNKVEKYDLVISSPLKRCQLLASKINTTNFELSNQIKEIDFGDWEQQAWDDIPRAESQQWMEDFINMAPPNGESLIAMQKRVYGFMNRLTLLKHEQIAVVTHAGVIRLVMAYVMNIPLEKIFNLIIAYGCIIEVKIELKNDKNSLNVKFIA